MLIWYIKKNFCLLQTLRKFWDVGFHFIDFTHSHLSVSESWFIVPKWLCAQSKPLIACNFCFLSTWVKGPEFLEILKRTCSSLCLPCICSLLPDLIILCIMGRFKKKKKKVNVSYPVVMTGILHSSHIKRMWQRGALEQKEPLSSALHSPWPFTVAHWGPGIAEQWGWLLKCMNKVCTIHSRGEPWSCK